MISKDFFRALEVLADERGISREKILDVMGRGILNAYKKDHSISDNARIEFNTVKNEIVLYAEYIVAETAENPGEVSLAVARKRRKTIKIGDTLVIKESPKDFGRIAVSSAKQILTQGLKQLEREKAYEEFKEKAYKNKMKDFYKEFEKSHKKKDYKKLFVNPKKIKN